MISFILKCNSGSLQFLCVKNCVDLTIHWCYHYILSVCLSVLYFQSSTTCISYSSGIKVIDEKTSSKHREWIQNCPSVKDVVVKFPPLTLGLKTLSSLSCLTIK